MVSVESDRREDLVPSRTSLEEICVCVVVRGWCMAIKSFGKGQEAVVLSRASVVGAFCYHGHLRGEKTVGWELWLG